MPIPGIRPPATFVAFKQCRHQLMRITNGLQILHVETNEFTEEFESLSEDVVWLRWDRFPLKSLPPWLTLRHLSVLELDFFSQSEELWEDNVDVSSLISSFNVITYKLINSSCFSQLSIIMFAAASFAIEKA